MNKKNTIFAAIIINTTLLVLLFSTAVSSEDPPIETISFVNREKAAPLEIVRKEKPLRGKQKDVRLAEDGLKKERQKVEIPSLHSLGEEDKSGAGISFGVDNECSDLLSRHDSSPKGASQKEKNRIHAPATLEGKPALSSKKPHAKYYTVQVGDNPWTIARKHKMKVKELLEKNGLDEKKARGLQPGDKLLVDDKSPSEKR